VASGLAWWESGWYAVVWIIFGGVGMPAICLGPWIYLAWKAGMLEERPPRREKETGLRCLWCGKRIDGGRFCTGTHYNLFVARYGRQTHDAEADQAGTVRFSPGIRLT